MKKVLSAWRVDIDGVELHIVSGSLTFTEGLPTRTVIGQEKGVPVYSENYEDAFSIITFDLRSTQENLDNMRVFNTRQCVTIKFYDGDYTRTMSAGVSINSNERGTGSDGVFTNEFHGTPIS